MVKEAQAYLRNNQSQNPCAPGITEEYIAQVSEAIEGRVNKKVSQEFSRTHSRILGAVSKIDKFLLNRQLRTFSGTVPGIFCNANVENQERIGDGSFPRWSLSWSGVLCLSRQQYNWLRPGRDLSPKPSSTLARKINRRSNFVNEQFDVPSTLFVDVFRDDFLQITFSTALNIGSLFSRKKTSFAQENDKVLLFEILASMDTVTILIIAKILFS